MQTLMNPKFRIWDLHCHLSGVPGLTPEERLGQLLRYADRVGIEPVPYTHLTLPTNREV